ncbi:glycoside hydrolase family 5 protein [Asticcacaulis sp. AC402]|uniref:glycoside hydrolase family 5 protein n=1 Tax=Asticcacaulis sp. AC402 TaxID=1282361 RepID=UPI0003C3F1F9|nr:glycoside hydrolase family 5 protein [Asticcacaulis sp. AC402]ESQ75221.1 hypothetical protein ABAC402_10260 [Asticcacaulis sp. AC402]
MSSVQSFKGFRRKISLAIGVAAVALFAVNAANADSSNLTAANALTEMSPGWNLGNTLEAIGAGSQPFSVSQETAWGNPAATQALMHSVKAAGFKSIRIPVSWKQYADSSDTINAAWLARVKDVVDYARAADLYVMINVHWDGGWLQPTYAAEAVADARLTKFWTQIGTTFKDYDDHLLFAGTNEVMVTGDYGTPKRENCEVQHGFNQTFVDAVRATGGNNTTRWLVIQGFNTNIDHTLLCNSTLPNDTATGRLMMEVHYYDPYNFTMIPAARSGNGDRSRQVLPIPRPGPTRPIPTPSSRR